MCHAYGRLLRHINISVTTVFYGRFTAFREESGPTWIVYAHYVKEGQKRDKTGGRAVEMTKKARERYFIRVKDGSYYERS